LTDAVEKKILSGSLSNFDSKRGSLEQVRFKKSIPLIRLLRVSRRPRTFSTASTHNGRALRPSSSAWATHKFGANRAQPSRGLYSLIVSLGLFHNSPQFVIRVQQRHGMFAAAHDQETMKFKVIPNTRHGTFIGWLKFFSQLFKRWCLRFARHDIVRPFVAPA
jgi:hypothetical protein